MQEASSESDVFMIFYDIVTTFFFLLKEEPEVLQLNQMCPAETHLAEVCIYVCWHAHVCLLLH